LAWVLVVATASVGCQAPASATTPSTAYQPTKQTSDKASVTAPSQSVAGIGSKWFEIFIGETQGYPNVPLSYTVALTSPVGMNYDLHVYEGATAPSASAEPDCSADPLLGVGTPESVHHLWAETPSYDNDGRWLSIYVEYVTGSSCDAGSEWGLTVTGHT